MDEISQKYQLAAQKQVGHIEAVSQAFQKQCESLRDAAEKQIAALDSKATDRQDQENHLKLKLKTDLKLVLTQFEKELRRSFGIGLVDLENIYREKEVNRLKEIEEEILSMK